MHAEDIARVCHEANRGLCEAFGDHSQLPWNDAPAWQRESAINGVKFIVLNPSATPGASHESWLAEKHREGWKYGPIKNSKLKEHPCFVPFNELPAEQQAKDFVFGSIVRAMLTL
jgi:hypothetical protein